MVGSTWFFPLLVFAILGRFHLGNASENSISQLNSDRVVKLPGQNFPVGFDHYSGYIKVNEDSGRVLFYWFMEAVEDPDSKPLLLWLNGGPGCSSIGYGQAEEIGPFYINSDGKSVHLNPYAWNNVANTLFLDSPVGVGYSYSETPSDILNNGDKRTADDSLVFLLKWFERYPQFKGRDFYIVGESYGGHYIPQLSQAIVRHNQQTKESPINLKGYMVGNAAFDDYYDQVGLFKFLWSSALISDQTYKLLNLECAHDSIVHPSESCEKILEVANQEMGKIDQYSIYTPTCTDKIGPLNPHLKRMHMVGRIRQGYDPCTANYTTMYFNLPEVQKALHVDPKHAPAKWETCNLLININWKDAPRSVLDIYHEMIDAGLRIWVYSGDTDAVVPVTGTRYSLNALHLKKIGHWQSWYDEGQVGGRFQEYEGLTFVTVRGAGHEVPLHRPKLAFQLLKAFLSGTPLSTPSPQLVSDT